MFFIGDLLSTPLIFINNIKIPKQTVQSMFPSKRSSVSSNKHNSVGSIDLQPNLDCQRIEKYIEYIKQSLRTHLRDKQYHYEETQLKELHKLIKSIQQYYLKNQKECEMTAKGLREELDRERQNREEVTKMAEAAAEERLKQMQRDHNQELLAINNLFGRKEQQYKEVIEKLVNGLNSAQRIQQSSQTKLQAATRCLQRVAEDKRNQQSIARGIKDIVEEIQLRQDNSKISDKSDEMSIDEIEISGKKMDHHMVEDSEHFEDAAYAPIEKRIESWLTRLICYGLFQKTNEECIKKMISFTANLDHPTQILKENVYPLISQVLVNNMKNNHEQAMRYIQGTTSILDPDESSHVQLRNINNLSELSVSDSQMDDLNFKKRDHF